MGIAKLVEAQHGTSMVLEGTNGREIAFSHKTFPNVPVMVTIAVKKKIIKCNHVLCISSCFPFFVFSCVYATLQPALFFIQMKIGLSFCHKLLFLKIISYFFSLKFFFHEKNMFISH